MVKLELRNEVLIQTHAASIVWIVLKGAGSEIRCLLLS
jgi:hypothetical protein